MTVAARPKARQRASRLLDENTLGYVRQLVAEYQTLPAATTARSGINLQAKTVADRIAERVEAFERGSDPSITLTWADAQALELALLRLQPLENLRRQSWNIRLRYRDLAGQRKYDQYLQSNPPDPKTAEEALLKELELRADLEALLHEIHWLYNFLPIREEARSRLIRRVAQYTLAAAVIALGVYFASASLEPARSSGVPVDMPLTNVLLVMMSGALGAFMSMLRRLQKVDDLGSPLSSLLEMQYGQLTVLLAPAYGAIFALLLYMIFVGELLRGGVFPDFREVREAMADTATTAAWANFGKLLVWSFIAGFAEQFVPDTLNRIIEKGRSEPGMAPLAPDSAGPLTGGAATAADKGATEDNSEAPAPVLSTRPENGGTIAAEDPLVIRFSAPMKDAQPALRVLSGDAGESIALEKIWDASRTELTLSHPPLAPGSYRLDIGVSVAPGEGEPRQIEFTVA
jgi:hypothetical protein